MTMPPKKKSTNKKKGKQKGGGGGPKKKQQPATTSNNDPSTNNENVVAQDADLLSITSISKPTISISCANSFASLFTADYPPQTTIRLYIKNELSKKEINLADKAYEECSSNFNKGIAQFHVMSEDPGPENSRWHLAQDMFLQALEAAMRFHGVFLKTTVSDVDIFLLTSALCI